MKTMHGVDCKKWKIIYEVCAAFFVVGKRKSGSAARCLIPALLTTSKASSVIRRSQHTSLAVLSVRFWIGFSELRSAFTVNFVSTIYGRNDSTFHTEVRKYRCVVSYLCSLSGRGIDQQPIDKDVPSFCC